jgi:predicted ATPase
VDRYHSQVRRLVRGRLVGRDAELEAALQVWGMAMNGQGQVLLVSGEPGIGKTRFVKELTTFAEVEGATVLIGECFSGDNSPYLPIAQIIREALDNGQSPELPPVVLSDLSALAPELVRYIPPDFKAATDIAQQRLLDSLLALCRSLADRAPLMLLVEDVHWADSGTVNVLRYLARRLRQRPFLLALTYRGTDLDEGLPFQELLVDLSRDLVAGRIKLTRLGRDETRDLLATLFDEAITPEFLEGIYRETEGNPFFIEEVSRALIDSGELFFRNGRWHRPEMSKLAIPQGVRVAIQSRLSRLSDDVQRVLQTAALLGREFRYDRLVAASEEDEDELIVALERAEEAQII